MAGIGRFWEIPLLAVHGVLVDSDGLRLVVRNGYLPERSIQTGIGAISVKQPRVHDQRQDEAGEKIRFQSSILPPYLRRSKSMEEFIPWLYLRGISTGDFSETMASILGRDAPGLSATTITRLKAGWLDEYKSWSKRSLKGKRYVYIWVDGIYSRIRLGESGEKQCLLVVMGATADGQKVLIAVEAGIRESELSWREILLNLKQRGLERRFVDWLSVETILLSSGPQPGHDTMLGIIGDDVESLLKSGFANFGYFRPQSVHLAMIQAPNLRIIQAQGHDEREGYADRSALVDGKNIMKLWT